MDRTVAGGAKHGEITGCWLPRHPFRIGQRDDVVGVHELMAIGLDGRDSARVAGERARGLTS